MKTQIIIVGGGNAEILISADKDYYQPAWTLVGGVLLPLTQRCVIRKA